MKVFQFISNYFAAIKENNYRHSRNQKSFKLLRYFSVTSFIAFSVGTFFLATLYRQQAEKDATLVGESKNIALTQAFGNSLLSEFRHFLDTASNLSKEEILAHPEKKRLSQATLQLMKEMSIYEVEFHDSEGKIIFSTELEDIGIIDNTPSFLTALSGGVSTEIEEEAGKKLLGSYVPIRSRDGKVLAVLEVYTDLTVFLERIEVNQRNIVLGVLLILSLLYSALFLIVQRADKIIKNQQNALRKSETQYREQASELEKTLTELKQTQAQLIHSEKMSSLGQLVAGIAHEINNPMSFIYGNLTHAQEYIQDLLQLISVYQESYPTPVAEVTDCIEKIDLSYLKEDLSNTIASMNNGADRICQIVLSLRNFSRLDESDMKKVDLHEGIDSTLFILQQRLDAKENLPDIEITKDYGKLPLVECFSGELNQVFLHILSNAIDFIQFHYQKLAFHERQKYLGKISISTTATTQDTVVIKIADNGCGMTEDIKNKIFDPFFTTKDVGKGTGLGLTVCYQVITQTHKGKITCNSATRTGSEFTIEIPIRQSRYAG